MTCPSVSVIIGTYNREPYVRQAVDSVLGQSFPDFELIVVDDASTDRTVETLQSCDARVRLIRREQNSGLPLVPRNQGMRAAQGEFIAFLDSDDYWHPTKLEKQVAFMRAHEGVALSHTFCEIVDADSRALYVRREKEMPIEGDLFGRLLRECFITTSTVMIRCELQRRVGGFNEDASLRRGEDHEFFLRVARTGAIGFIPEVLAAHRKFDGNVSGSGFEFQKRILHTQQWILHHPQLWQGAAPRGKVLDGLVDACVAYSYDWQAQGRFGRALYFSLRAWRAAPLSRRAAGSVVKTLAKSALHLRGGAG